MTTVFDQLRGLIERLRLSTTSQANAKARELASTNGFKPAVGICLLFASLALAVIRRWVA